MLWDIWPDHSVLGDCFDHSPTTARGLRRSLLDLCSGTASTTLRPQLGNFASQLHATDDSHTVGIFFSPLDLATRLIPRLTASSGTTSTGYCFSSQGPISESSSNGSQQDCTQAALPSSRDMSLLEAMYMPLRQVHMCTSMRDDHQQAKATSTVPCNASSIQANQLLS